MRRADLTPVQLADHMNRRKRIYLERHPETQLTRRCVMQRQRLPLHPMSHQRRPSSSMSAAARHDPDDAVLVRATQDQAAMPREIGSPGAFVAPGLSIRVSSALGLCGVTRTTFRLPPDASPKKGARSRHGGV